MVCIRRSRYACDSVEEFQKLKIVLERCFSKESGYKIEMLGVSACEISFALGYAVLDILPKKPNVFFSKDVVTDDEQAEMDKWLAGFNSYEVVRRTRQKPAWSLEKIENALIASPNCERMLSFENGNAILGKTKSGHPCWFVRSKEGSEESTWSNLYPMFTFDLDDGFIEMDPFGESEGRPPGYFYKEFYQWKDSGYQGDLFPTYIPIGSRGVDDKIVDKA